jgi:hypothetical protein
MLEKLDASIAAEIGTHVPSEDNKTEPNKRKHADQSGGTSNKRASMNSKQADSKSKTTQEMSVEEREATAIEDLREFVKLHGGKNELESISCDAT